MYVAAGNNDTAERAASSDEPNQICAYEPRTNTVDPYVAGGTSPNPG